MLGAGCGWEMLKATPAGLAEQTKPQSPKSPKAPPAEKTKTKLSDPPPGRLAQGGEKGGGGGKGEAVAEGSVEALAVRVSQRGHEVSERF